MTCIIINGFKQLANADLKRYQAYKKAGDSLKSHRLNSHLKRKLTRLQAQSTPAH